MWQHSLIRAVGMSVVFLVVNHTDAGEVELAKGIKALAAADSYRFTVHDGPAGAVEAKYHKDSPLFCLADKIEFFRKGDVLVYKQNDAWQRTRTGTLSDPLRILGASAKVRAVRLPHSELATLGKALAKVKKSKVDGQLIVSGEFAAEAAQQLARTEDRDLARGGTARLWLDAGGRLTKYEFVIRVQGKRGNADVDGTVTRMVAIDGVGMTKVDVPAAAKKALD